MRFNGGGIAAIVGPNGCGKSNLSDAISWVLGEQSAKSLRGSRMQDVIFAGTSLRKPLGMASVTMTLVDPAWHAAAIHQDAPGNGGHAFHELETSNEHHGIHGANGINGTKGTNGHHKTREITITRRLYRSGESEYLIDGKLARLRDIQDLFLGTGLGPESYAIIEQGRVGQILSSRPQDRRAVIEEAAGISKFKTKRKLAEAKLEGARQNLARVFDILEEVGRQVNSLNRQAKKAERYRKLREELLVELRRTLAGRFRLLERDAARTVLELNEANAAFQQRAAGVREREAAQSETQRQAYDVERQLTGARARQAELQVESERTRGRLESQVRQVSDIELRLTQGETETQTLERQRGEVESQCEAHERTLEALDTETTAAREALVEKGRERDAAQAGFREREEWIESTRRTVLRLLGEASQLRTELSQLEEYLASIGRDATRADRERQASAEEAERLTAARRDAEQKLETQRAELEAVAGERRRVEESLNQLRARLTEARRALETLRSDTSRLRARRESLDEILSHRAYTTESVKRFFTAIERGRQTGIAPLGVLADFVEVDPEFEKATEEFLHDELEYILVKDWEQARRGVDLMRSDLDGRATFLVHPEPDAGFGAAPPEPPLGPETGIVARLSQVLRMTNGLTHAPAELLPRLARCLIAESHEAARRLALQYPDFHFLLPDGVSYHGYAVSGGKKTASGPLALKRELRELTATLTSQEKRLAEAAAGVEELESAIAALGEQLERLRTEQQHHEKEVVASEGETRKLAEDWRRAEQRRSIAAEELARLAEAREKAAAQRGEFVTRIEEKETQRRAEETALEEARAALEEMRDRVGRLGEEHSALRVQLAGCEERGRAEQAARQRLRSQRAELERRLQEVAGELGRLGAERQRLIESNVELEGLSARLTQSLAAIAVEAGELSNREGALREDLAAMEEDLRRLRAEVQETQERRSQIEVALAERRADLKYLEETCIRELRMTLPDVASAEPDEIDEVALAEAEDRLAQIRERIEGLGPVNPAALEEYEEARQRYDFLNAQRQDLLDSIRDTEKAIKDIDAETRKRFANAFEVINENFKRTFQTLFAGGVGEMRLSDPENPGESGIDVVASPPGKRLQNVLLLSGGEKALTALALLMAIFQFQPSPFCVLDEVDAPLDEANIRRMIRLLRGMAHQTQFVVITHAKSTMEAAESLYGVTMQEPGVSKLVSVKFNPLPEAPAPAVQAAVAPPS